MGTAVSVGGTAVDVGVNVDVGDIVAVGDGVLVAVGGTAVFVGSGVPVAVGSSVAVAVGSGVTVAVADGTGVLVGSRVAVDVAVTGSGVGVSNWPGVGNSVAVGSPRVLVATEVGMAVRVPGARKPGVLLGVGDRTEGKVGGVFMPPSGAKARPSIPKP